MYYKSMGADLGFNILEQVLTGEIDGVSISAHAVSGGRAGSKTKGVVNEFLANNPYLTSQSMVAACAAEMAASSRLISMS